MSNSTIENSRIITNTYHPNHLDINEGVLMLVNKPLEWTSFDVVNKLRFRFKHLLGKKKFKVGHAGTLDPMADGLLLICAGKYTKSIDQLSGMDKCYTATIKLGATTASYDSETEEENMTDVDHLSLASLNLILSHFTGDLLQKPPIYSAIKMQGQAAYKLARRGEDFEMKPRPIFIHQINLLSFQAPFLKIKVCCSKGTYIRSLAHDIGAELNVGGYLRALTRDNIGPYLLENAMSLDECLTWIDSCSIAV